MLTTADFLTATQWAGLLTLICGAIATLGFILQWGIRFRFVGVTGFMLVLTVGLFSLSLVPFTRSIVPGSVKFATVYDSGANQAVITVPTQITEAELAATLQQAATDLFSPGRLNIGGSDKLTIRARTLLHPQDGISQPLYLGEIKRSLLEREDNDMQITLYPQNLAQLPHEIPTPEEPAAE
jgi:Protein of function (DUF2518)